MHKLDEIFNNIECGGLEIEQIPQRKYHHYIYLMNNWKKEDDDLCPFVLQIRRLILLFPDVVSFFSDDLTKVEIELVHKSPDREFALPNKRWDVCAFSFINPDTRSVMRLYDVLRTVAVELDKQNHYMFLDDHPLHDSVGHEFLYSEMIELHRIEAHIKEFEKYADNAEDLLKTHYTREQLRVSFLHKAICKAYEHEIEAGQLDDSLLEWILRHSNNINLDKGVKFSEITDMRGFADCKTPCDGDKPHEVWDALPYRFVKTAFIIAYMKDMRRPETIALRVPELSNEWVKNCSRIITDSRVFTDTTGDIVILYKLAVHDDNNQYIRRIYLMTKLYTSHRKFPYEEANKYFKLLLNDGHILDDILLNGRTS